MVVCHRMDRTGFLYLKNEDFLHFALAKNRRNRFRNEYAAKVALSTNPASSETLFVVYKG